jgi:hypothetical protein
MIASFLIFSEDTQPSAQPENIDQQWVKVKLHIRKNFKKMKLAELDRETLNVIEISTIPPEVEKNLAELLYEIMEDDLLYGKDNCVKAVKLLHTKFKDKQQFFDYASQFAYEHPSKSSFVIAEIFRGLKASIEGHYDQNLQTLKVVYESIRPTYMATDKGGIIEGGTNDVIYALIDYLREYLRLLDQNKFQEEPRKKYLIHYIYKDLNLDSQTSNFINIPGAKELRLEYFSLQEKYQQTEGNKKQ